MGKDAIEELGLDEPLDRTKVLEYMLKLRIMPYWTENRGLIFRPHVGRIAARRFQEILHLDTKEDVERVRLELRQASSAPSQQ
jgi:hypothetical protein